MRDDQRPLADPGIVYLVVNAAMPNHVKIGLTRRDDVAQRLRELDTTSVPMPFECAYSARVPDCGKLERVLHQVFGDKRVRPNREFFTADPELVRLVIDLVKIEEQPLSDAEQGISAEEREVIEQEKERRSPRFSIERLGLQPGEVLHAVKDAALTCEVVGGNKVRFQGEVMTLSAAALKAIHQLGYSWRAISGPDFWTYNGVKLNAIAPATEG